MRLWGKTLLVFKAGKLPAEAMFSHVGMAFYMKNNTKNERNALAIASCFAWRGRVSALMQGIILRYKRHLTPSVVLQKSAEARVTSSSGGSALRNRLPFVHILANIKRYGASNDDALDDLLPVGVNADKRQAVVDNLEDEYTRHYAANGTNTAG